MTALEWKKMILELASEETMNGEKGLSSALKGLGNAADNVVMDWI